MGSALSGFSTIDLRHIDPATTAAPWASTQSPGEQRQLRGAQRGQAAAQLLEADGRRSPDSTTRPGFGVGDFEKTGSMSWLLLTPLQRR